MFAQMVHEDTDMLICEFDTALDNSFLGKVLTVHKQTSLPKEHEIDFCTSHAHSQVSHWIIMARYEHFYTGTASSFTDRNQKIDYDDVDFKTSSMTSEVCKYRTPLAVLSA